MSAIAEILEDGETIEFSVDVPDKDEFVPCTTCGHRSCLHFWYKDDIMSFCKNHGERGWEKLELLGADLIADYREELLTKK